jgi:thioredoxin reductase (NADPH)
MKESLITSALSDARGFLIFPRKSMQEKYDVIIIGAGPAGLTAGLYCGRSGLRTLVLGDPYGSQVASADLIENYPGFSGIRGMELIEKMAEQTKAYAENIPQNAEKIERKGKLFLVKTSGGNFSGRCIIICTGAVHRKLGVKGEGEFSGRGISYCATCDGPLYRGRKVAVVGYGNGAAKASLYLSKIAKVILLCTRKNLGCEEVYLERIVKKKIKILYDIKMERIDGKESVQRIFYECGGRKRSMRVEAVFVESGMVPNTELAGKLGVKLTKNGFIEVDERQETNIKGVFAAGDVTGGRNQIVTAVGEGANSALSVIEYLK